jgi:hypothetical protein
MKRLKVVVCGRRYDLQKAAILNAQGIKVQFAKTDLESESEPPNQKSKKLLYEYYFRLCRLGLCGY